MTRTTAKTAGIRAKLRRASVNFWALCILVIASFLLGGSARSDAVSLMVLRPLTILLIGVGLSNLRFAHVKAHWFLFAMILAIVALPALQLIPMPPTLWSQLPGRALIAQIDQAAGLGDVWRPISLTPLATRNALYAALLPCTVLVLGVQLDNEDRRRLLPLVLILGGLSALLGVLQTLSDPNGALYFYRVTNNGLSVGLFANRNHQALLLAMMLPMLAVLARGGAGTNRARELLALTAGLLVLPLILITGSRSGMIAAAVALLAVPFLLCKRPHPHPKKSTNRTGRGRLLAHAGRLGTVLLGVGLVVVTIWLGRGAAWDRLLASDPSDDLRLKIIPTLTEMIIGYFPWGSGQGSFERVYQVYEPDALLSPVYMNHAHNDWLEVLMTGGAAAAFLLLIAVIGFLFQLKSALTSRDALSCSLQYARLGLVMVLLAALASVGDYPLRVPSHAVLFTLAALWSACSLPQSSTLSAAQ